MTKKRPGVPRATADATVRLVAKRVRDLRVSAALPQEALAHAAGLSVKYLSEIENARTNASITVLGRLADGLGVSLSALFADGAAVGSVGDLRDDLATVAAIVGAQPAAARRQAIRLLRALFEGPTK